MNLFRKISPVKTLLPLLLCALGTTSEGASYPLPVENNDVIGETLTVKSRYEDTLSDIARLHDLGYREITQANPDVDPWLPGEGSKVIIPTRFILPPGPRKGIVINLAELRLYYYPPGEKQVITYPLGIGREGWSTPIGNSRITRKQQNPTWTPPASIRREQEARGVELPKVVAAGPNNPLGEYAIYLGMPGYLIHGTNRPYGVGLRVSHGCIRLYPEDIRSLYEQIPIDTAVSIINEPYKAGWHQGELFVEAHIPLSEQTRSEGNNLTPLVAAVVAATRNSEARPDWKQLKQAALDATGIPRAISSQPTGQLTQPAQPIHSSRLKLLLSLRPQR
ncbi:MAG: L,D-transpeptidase family protein [Gammaproteobacteria bacterium]|nr:L,D-transpeptidase family protein [Gammaproteobacteria bacterium]